MHTHIALFAGAGIGCYALKHHNTRTVGYVEWSTHCQKIIAQRIIEGHLDDAPIYGDIEAFLSEGYAHAYSGLVDIISGGFPCQPFSSAGVREGEASHKNRWPQTLDVIKIIKPRTVLLENVAALNQSRTRGYFREIVTSIASTGYRVAWGVLSAGAIGAPHKRSRLWIRGDRFPDSNG